MLGVRARLARVAAVTAVLVISAALQLTHGGSALADTACHSSIAAQREASGNTNVILDTFDGSMTGPRRPG